MTYGDIMAQILSEVSGKPKDQVGELMETFKLSYPGKNKLDDEVPDDKAQQLLNDLRKEKDGIRLWLLQGALRTERNTGHT